MHSNHLSVAETAYHFNLGNNHIVGKWERIYYEEGPQALYEERRNRRMKNMSSKPRKKKLSKDNRGFKRKGNKAKHVKKRKLFR